MENPCNQWKFRDASSCRPEKMPRNSTSHFGSSDFHTGEIDHYFHTSSIEDYDWVRNPFLEILSREGIFTLREEEELPDIRHDRTLKLKHPDSSLDSFWVSSEMNILPSQSKL